MQSLILAMDRIQEKSSAIARAENNKAVTLRYL